MAAFVEINGKRVEIPAEVRGKGAAAVAAWEKEQRKPARGAAGGDK